jgi:hypothetical protein
MTIDTSMTSRNIVPHAHRFLEANIGHMGPKAVKVLDLGCGRFQKGLDFLNEAGFEARGIDPHNRPDTFNRSTQAWVTANGGADVVLVSNVLNVIEDADEREEVIWEAFQSLRPFGIVIVTVYEGDRSGEEGPTRDGYQRNQPIHVYHSEIGHAFPRVDVQRRGKCLILRREDGVRI